LGLKRLALIALRRSRQRRLRAAGMRIGARTIIYGRVIGGSEPWLVEVGEDCEIASGVVFLTHDGGVRVWRDVSGAAHLNRYGPIRIGRNCLIGYRAILVGPLEIGDNCVVGAGSVVIQDVPPNSVVAGNPARVISSLADYGAKVERETLLDLGHTADELWAALWDRLDAPPGTADA
jgi:acetyltransferase-like isoleucine patch superfamily enzyme